jgi:sucrose-6-phosphate hydrolase SacC (GH32 family)
MQPIALQSDDYDIWAGSTVIDQNNTSGFFPNQTNGVVAVFTQHHTVTGKQEQAIAYSTDGGHTFTKYSKNPILPRTDENRDFRDPKVIGMSRPNFGSWQLQKQHLPQLGSILLQI